MRFYAVKADYARGEKAVLYVRWDEVPDTVGRLLAKVPQRITIHVVDGAQFAQARLAHQDPAR